MYPDDAARRIFLRAISALFVVAFVSLWIEIHGLIGMKIGTVTLDCAEFSLVRSSGSEGISPVDDLYERLRTGITEVFLEKELQDARAKKYFS